MQLWADRERQLLPHAGLLTHTVDRIVRCFNHRDYAERPDCHGYRGRLITMSHILSGKRRVFAVMANGPEDEHARGDWAALADHEKVYPVLGLIWTDSAADFDDPAQRGKCLARDAYVCSATRSST